MAEYSAIDLSKLAPPTLVEALSYEEIFQEMLADFKARLPGYDVFLETDPAIVILQASAYREFLIRGRVNDAGRGVMVAFAVGADLDNIAAIFGITRLTITPADTINNVAAVMESDDDFRRRVVLAPEGYSVAGPEGAYIFHALSADADVLDASAISPEPGVVLVSVLSRSGNGQATPSLLAKVDAYLTDETRRPLTDFVTVQTAQIVGFAVNAVIFTFNGPDSAVVLANARASLDAYLVESHRIGRDVTRSGVFRALHVEGVQNVVLNSPAADIVISRTQATHCTGVNLAHGGIDE